MCVGLELLQGIWHLNTILTPLDHLSTIDGSLFLILPNVMQRSPKTALFFSSFPPAFEAPSCLSALHSALQALVTENEADIEGANPQPF